MPTTEGQPSGQESRVLIGGDLHNPVEEISKQAEITRVEIGEHEALYVYCNVDDSNYTSEFLEKIAKDIESRFQEAFPDTKIIVGFVDLKFTAITKKQEFSSRLDGSVS